LVGVRIVDFVERNSPLVFTLFQAIYGKSSSKAFMSEIFAPVIFHNKTPVFHEEIKIALPLNLNKSHHILFTFIHVSCTTKKGKDDEVITSSFLPSFLPSFFPPSFTFLLLTFLLFCVFQTILGHAWLSVFDGKIVGNQEHSLPIASELEKNYDTSKTVKVFTSLSLSLFLSLIFSDISSCLFT
jgi:hypothetical protein